MILLLALDADIAPAAENYTMIRSVFPDWDESRYCGTVIETLAEQAMWLGIYYPDDYTAKGGDTLLEAILELQQSLPHQKTGRSLAFFAGNVSDFREGGKLIADLLSVNPAMVLGFQYKSGSFPSAVMVTALEPSALRDMSSLRRGFPTPEDLAFSF